MCQAYKKRAKYRWYASMNSTHLMVNTDKMRTFPDYLVATRETLHPVFCFLFYLTVRSIYQVIGFTGIES